MKRRIKAVFSAAIVAALAGGLIAITLTTRGTAGNDAGQRAPRAADSKLAQAGAGEITVKVAGEMQKRLALHITQLVTIKLKREIKAFGSALDATPLHTQVSDTLAAEVSVQLSQQELARLRKLQDNTSARLLQTAEATARRDQILLQSARNNLRLTWGNAIAERKDLSDLVQSLAVQANSLVRLDLPVGDIFLSQPSGARIVAAGADSSMAGEVLGIAPNVDARNQAQGILVLAPQQGGVNLLAGTAVTGFVEVSGEPMSGVVIPRSAVVRYIGKTWVYLQLDADTFVRREVILENPVDDGWLVSRGLGQDDRIVDSGAQILLSDESKANINMAE